MKNILRIILFSLLMTSLSNNLVADTKHDEGVKGEGEHADTHKDSSHGEEGHDEHGEDGHGEEGHDDESDQGEGDHSEEKDHGHDEKSTNGEEESSIGVHLSERQTSLAEITVEILQAQVMDYTVYAPGEIRANGYTSYQVSPRVDSVVLRRHVSLGDHVDLNQALVTLFSETVADAQASYRIDSAEWKRVKQLGRKTVGDKRYITAESDFDASFGRLRAYGLTKKAISSVNTKARELGEYTLVAAIEGAVLSDDFHQGQRVEAGEALIELTDEKALWVEARLAPTAQLKLPAGTKAKIKVGDEWFSAVVTQEAHTIDIETRTRIVRLLVNNDTHRLHPGQFADVYFSFETKDAVLAVPEGALMRGSDGDWVIFIEDGPGEFSPVEVDLGRSLGKFREIIGVPPGKRVVMQGAFFVASQIAKGGFDPHNH